MKKTLTVLFALVTVASLVSCGGREKKREAGSPVRVRTDIATERPMPSAEAYSGNVRSRRAVVISTKMMGRITKIAVDEGQRVKKGQLLLVVDASEAKSAWEQSRAALEAAEVAVRNAERDEKRFTALYKERAVTKHKLEQVEAGLAQAKAMKVKAEANQKMASTLLTYGTIRATEDGIVTKKWMDVGNMAYPGAPILTVENPKKLELSVSVPEEKARLLSVGGRASVIVDSPAETFRTKISAVVAAADPMSRTSIVKLALPNDKGLRPGQFVSVRFDALARKVLTVPTTAVFHEGQLDGVFVVEDGRAALRWIQTGQSDGRFTQITAGLSDGEKVVSPIPAGLVDNTPLEVAR